jgi:hypothetical protein
MTYAIQCVSNTRVKAMERGLQPPDCDWGEKGEIASDSVFDIIRGQTELPPFLLSHEISPIFVDVVRRIW